MKTKGNYSYNWVQDIDLTEVLKDTTVGRGHVLYLEVDLKKQVWERRVRLRSLIRRIILSSGRLSRVMEMWVLSTEKDLNETIDLASGVSYQVNYTVTEKKTEYLGSLILS